MTLVSIPLMDKTGRRTLHLYGLGGMFIFSIFITISFLIKASIRHSIYIYLFKKGLKIKILFLLLTLFSSWHKILMAFWGHHIYECEDSIDQLKFYQKYISCNKHPLESYVRKMGKREMFYVNVYDDNDFFPSTVIIIIIMIESVIHKAFFIASRKRIKKFFFHSYCIFSFSKCTFVIHFGSFSFYVSIYLSTFLSIFL